MCFLIQQMDIIRKSHKSYRIIKAISNPKYTAFPLETLIIFIISLFYTNSRISINLPVVACKISISQLADVICATSSLSLSFSLFPSLIFPTKNNNYETVCAYVMPERKKRGVRKKKKKPCSRQRKKNSRAALQK